MAPDEITKRTIEITAETEDQARELIRMLRNELGTFEGFIARRFDELSVEINATSQQMGMVEKGIVTRFGDIIGVLNSISKHGEGFSAANTGVELDTVIKTTEDAANSIMDAADKIAANLQKKIDWSNDNARQELLNDINNSLQEILLACTFQDLTGQRITRALDNLRAVESQLSNTLKALGIEISENALTGERGESEGEGGGGGAVLQITPASQDDIDALFG